MWHKKTTRIASILLSGIIVCTSFTGCGVRKEAEKKVIEPMEIEKVATYSFDFIGGKDVMPITGYHGPQTYQYSALGQNIPDYFSDEFMQMVADCGVNIIVATGVDYTKKTSYAQRLLELGNKSGVGMFLHDTTVNGNLGEDTLSIEELDEQINKYLNEPSCCGLYVIDEPANELYFAEQTQKYIKDYGQLFENLDKLGVFRYCNLYPITSMAVLEKYQQYLDEYLETCNTIC